ncbi:MAG: hypothetical protein IID45_10810 [Planctomycetes bacterium]|nr:hypothetical protein [Planctomycetota bacterium]
MIGTLTLTLTVFLGIPVPVQTMTPGNCFDNYHQGHSLARKTHKPLLVIFNAGRQTQKNAISLVSLRKTKARRDLLKNYVVVVIDTTTPHGKHVYKCYQKPKLPYVVILDKRQKYQIHYAAGDKLYGQKWTEMLVTFRKGERVVQQPTAQYCYT